MLAVVRERVDGTVEPGVLRDAAREVVDGERARLGAGEAPRDVTTLGAAVEELLRSREQGWREGLVPVINATGVIVHTNLGRAPWPEEAGAIAVEAARTYLLLELDRETGRRGHRYRAAEDALVELTGAEDALVTNNNAAAVALAVGLAGRGGVAVSRGELVEIGGGVRIPEIVRRAGARLSRSGRRTGRAPRTSRSRWPMGVRGWCSASIRRTSPRAGSSKCPMRARWPSWPTATARSSWTTWAAARSSTRLASGSPTSRCPASGLPAGSDVVTFSGDKLVGGPQAGLVVGRADLIAKMRKDPLARAMRPDKATLAAVAATLGLYRAGRAERTIPVWRMIAMPLDTLRERAEALVAALDGADAGRPRPSRFARPSAAGRFPGRRCRPGAWRSRCGRPIGWWRRCGVARRACWPVSRTAGSSSISARCWRTRWPDFPAAIAAALGRAREP